MFEYEDSAGGHLAFGLFLLIIAGIGLCCLYQSAPKAVVPEPQQDHFFENGAMYSHNKMVDDYFLPASGSGQPLETKCGPVNRGEWMISPMTIRYGWHIKIARRGDKHNPSYFEWTRGVDWQGYETNSLESTDTPLYIRDLCQSLFAILAPGNHGAIQAVSATPDHLVVSVWQEYNTKQIQELIEKTIVEHLNSDPKK